MRVVSRSLAVLFLLVATAQAQKTEFIRVVEEDNVPVALETATVSYILENENADPIRVDLVGVIHIADKAYYKKLNKEFENYQVVLYELVAPPGARPPKDSGPRSDNPLAMVQQMMKRALALDHQLEVVDYEKDNFVHADLSFGAMIEAAQKRGEDKFTFGMGIMRDVMISMNKMNQGEGPENVEVPEIDIVGLFLGDREEGTKLKRFFSQSIDPKKTGLGKTVENSLIADRNAACLKVLQEQIDAGKTKIAIFYGAAHMPDFEKRLVLDYGMKKGEQKWLTAWDMQEE